MASAVSRCEPRLGTEEIELIRLYRSPVDDDDWRDAIPGETPPFFFHVEGAVLVHLRSTSATLRTCPWA